jgi:hypothetical protein
MAAIGCEGAPSRFPNQEYICDTELVPPAESMAAQIFSFVLLPGLGRLFGIQLRHDADGSDELSETVKSNRLLLVVTLPLTNLLHCSSSLCTVLLRSPQLL